MNIPEEEIPMVETAIDENIKKILSLAHQSQEEMFQKMKCESEKLKNEIQKSVQDEVNVYDLLRDQLVPKKIEE